MNFLKKHLSVSVRLALPCLLFISHQLSASAFESSLERYGSEPIRVSMVRESGATPQQWSLIGMEDGQIEVRLATGGEMGLAPSRSLATQLRFPSVETETFQAAARAGRYADAVRELRPLVYPLLRYSELPNAFSHVFDSIALLQTHLLNAELYEESVQILEAFPALFARSAIQPQIFRLVQGLADRGEATRAVRLLGQIPVDSLPDGVENLLLSFAYDLRIAGEFEALIPVYEAMIPELSGSARREAEIWLAYCYLNADQIDDKARIVDEIGEIAPGEPHFGLFQLLEGYSAVQEGNYELALDILARGIVYARPGETWLPEANYLLGSSYEALGKLEAARNTFIEIARLNPDNPWGGRAREAHDKLTPDETTSEDEEISS